MRAMNRAHAGGALAAIIALCSVAGCSSMGSVRGLSAASEQPWAAATAVAAPLDLPDDTSAFALLRSAAAAAEELSFEGVTISTQSGGGEEQLDRVVHIPGRGTITVPIGQGDGGQLIPDGADSTLPGAARFLDLLAARYAVTVGGEGKVMNRPADVVEAHDSAHRLLARFWVDRKTNLMVKRQLIDPSTAVVRTVEFESLTTPARSTPDVTATASQGPQLTEVAVGRLRSEGWVCPQALPGGLTFVSADETDSGAVHMVYSDGLDVVSLFVQKGRLDPQRMGGMTMSSMAGGTVFSVEGASPTLVWSSQGSVLTLMSDLPRPALIRIVTALAPDVLTN